MALAQAILSFFGCLLCGVMAGHNFYEKRSLRGSLWLCFGLLWGWSGAYLWLFIHP